MSRTIGVRGDIKLITFFVLASLIASCVNQPVLTSHSVQRTELDDASNTSRSSQIGPVSPRPQVWARTSGRPSPSPSGRSEIVLDEKYFVVHYDPSAKLARYVEYTLTADHLRGSHVKRADRFHADDELLRRGLPAVGPHDYQGSGFDRGHLAPSADFTWSEEANDATFTMANMTPQAKKLNRQAWRGLEEQTRKWACGEGRVRVVTGPVPTPLPPTGVAKAHDYQGGPREREARLESGVVIPERFFKVIIHDSPPPAKAIGFIMSQDETRLYDYEHDAVTVAEVEALTGIDFLASFATDVREEIETYFDPREWREENCKSGSPSRRAHDWRARDWSAPP